MKAKEPCGCTHDGARWLSECEPHRAENDALHVRAMAEHRQARARPLSPTAELDWLSLPTVSPT